MEGEGSITMSSSSSESSDDSIEQQERACERSSHYSHHDTEYAAKVRAWAIQVPIGLGLCPWARKSNNKDLLRVVTCDCETPTSVAEILEREIELLINNSEGGTTPPLSTTLMVCPYVKIWKEFQPFDEFVKSGLKQLLKNVHVMEDVTLVAFHPDFLRWRGLPEGVGIGSVVQSHWGATGQKSIQTAEATIIETENKAFGLRRVKVRFHDNALEGLSRQEQFVPNEWIDFSNNEHYRPPLPPLPDNCMHRSPYPTIHIIVNQDLASLCVRDVSRVKRLNAQRVAKLGWEGLGRRLAVAIDDDVTIK